MKNLIYISCFLILFSCNPVASDSGTDSSSQTDITIPSIAAKEDTWEAYWKTFQGAVASDDIAQVADLTKFGNHISEESFNDYYDVYFGKEMKKIIANTNFSDVSSIEDGVEFPEGRSIAYEETGYDDEGNEMGSALILYFGKEEGSFKLMMFFAAG